MNQRFAILCPGQGGQHPGMFDLVHADPRGSEILQALGMAERFGLISQNSVSSLLTDPEQLFANRYAQALIVAAGLASWECLRSSLPVPDLVLGYSVGELTAYSVAGFWSPAMAVETAVQRARYMDDCLTGQPAQGLMAVTGMPLEQRPAWLQTYGIDIAIETDDDSIIAGGTLDKLRAAQTELDASGVRTTLLPVSVASHTPLMLAAVAPYAKWLDGLSWQAPSSRLIAGVTAQAVQHQQEAAAVMLRQLTETIHWASCMDSLVEQGIGVALELGPGTALSRMLRQRHPDIACRSLADFRTISGALTWLERQLQ
jgi:[acyl-carrier-protein] S-malonyltransferase